MSQSYNDTTELWRAGIVGLWYLRPSQLDLYEVLVREKAPFLECARRFGKTTTILTYVIEKCLTKPKTVVLWCEPWKSQAREIVMPEIEKIFSTCPKEMRPSYVTTDSFYKFPNGSVLKLRGVNDDKGASARGSYSHIIVADEFGFWRDPENIVASALSPQLLTTDGQFIFASTPALDLNHPYYQRKARALSENRFIQKTIFDNESLTEEQIEAAAKEVGGKDSTAWKREYLCEEISDPERLVIPEYSPDAHDLEDDEARPVYFSPYVGFDLGFSDQTFACFGYFDFEKATLIIDDELCVSGKNSKEIADAAREIERRNWGSLTPDRVADNDLQQIYDMATMCGYQMIPSRKDDKMAAINALRLRFGSGKIRIRKRCKNLRYQLKVGLWKENRKDFERGDGVGHLDGIMALVYLNRFIDERKNPVPLLAGMSIDTHFISPSYAQQENQEALKKAFKPF